MIHGTPREANSLSPVPSAARPSRTARRMLFSFMTRSRLSSHYAGPAALAACSSEGPKHSARPGFQPKVGDAVFREGPGRCRHAARDCLAGDREGFVGIIDGGRNDTPAPVLADFRV